MWFERAYEFAPDDAVDRIDHGWLDIEDVRWARSADIPNESTAKGTPFRSAAESGVVARRSAPSSYEALLIWLASDVEHPWQSTPRRIALTEDSVLAEFNDGDTYMLPRSALRERLDSSGKDSIFLFGRCTRLVLIHREGCEVHAALSKQLDDH